MLRVLDGSADRSDRQPKPATPGAADRLKPLEQARRMTASIVARIEQLIEEHGDRDSLETILSEYRRQYASLVSLSAAVGAIEREIRDTPKPEEPNAFDEFRARANRATNEGQPS